jgi:hypothetical protein
MKYTVLYVGPYARILYLNWNCIENKWGFEEILRNVKEVKGERYFLYCTVRFRLKLASFFYATFGARKKRHLTSANLTKILSKFVCNKKINLSGLFEE